MKTIYKNNIVRHNGSWLSISKTISEKEKLNFDEWLIYIKNKNKTIIIN